MLPQDPFTNILTVNTTLTVLEDQRYTAVVSFSNLAGEFSTKSIDIFGELTLEMISVSDSYTIVSIIIIMCILHVYM